MSEGEIEAILLTTLLAMLVGFSTALITHLFAVIRDKRQKQRDCDEDVLEADES